MKLQGLTKVCAIVLCCLCSHPLLAQQLKLGTNPSTLKPSALLELESTKQALLITRIADTSQITSPINGMIIYLTTDNSFRVRANNYWNKLIPEGSAIQSINSDLTPAQKIVASYTPAGTFGFATAAGTHTLTIPDAGLTAAGFMNIGAQSFKGLKNFTDGLQSANLRVVNDLSTPTKVLGKDANGDVSALTLDPLSTLTLTAGTLKANNTTKLWNANKLADYDVLFATAPATDQVLTFNGTQWIAKAAASAIQSINSDLTPAQKIVASYTPAGTFGFATAAGTHTLTIPDAGLTAAGFMNIGAQSFKGLKNFTDGLQSANLRVVNDLSTPTKVLGKDANGDVSALTLDPLSTLTLTAGTLKANNTTKLWNANKIADYDVLFATAPATDQVLTFNGTQWIAKAAAGAIQSINSDLTPAQKIVASYTPAGTFGFATAAGTHTLTIPDAGLTAAGFMNIGAQSFKGLKNFTDGLQSANLRVVNDLSTPTKVLGKDANGDVSALTLDPLSTLTLTAGTLKANNTTKLWNANKIADYDVLFATAPATDQVLTFNGTQWIAKAATGGITSIGLSLPSLFTVTGSPLTANGTITANLANQNANLVFAGPASGGAAAPTFRSLGAGDIPTNLGAYIQNTTTQQATSNFNISGNGVIAGTLGVGTATPGNKVEITGPSFAPTAPFNISGLRLTNLVGALATSIPATSKVLSINSSGDVILTDNPSTTNWLTGGNAATATQFLGTTNAVDMVVKYNSKELFRGSRGQTAAESGGADFSAYTLTLFNGATKFNGHPLIIRANGNDVLAFEDASGTPKWHWNILGGGLNFVETNVADYRLFLQNGGNVGVGTSTPARLLHVAGTMRVTGSAGTPTSMLGRDGNGDVNNVAADATTLTMSAGSLSANNTSNIWNAGDIQGVDVSTTAPTNGQVLQYNGTQWAPINPSPIRVITTGTSTSMTTADYSVIINKTGNYTVTLPNPTSVPVGKIVVVRRTQASGAGNTTTINSAGAANIDGASSIVSAANVKYSVILQSDGSNWYTLSLTN